MANRSSMRLAILLALVAIGLGLLARSFLSSAAPQIDVGAPAAAQSTTPAIPSPSPSVAAIPDTPAPAAAVESRHDPAGERAAAATPEELELADALWVTGRLRFPEHTPLGEMVEVIAEGKKFKNRELHRARVNSDGTFRVAFSKDTRTGRLAIDAPHLYLSAPLAIKPATAASGHVLEPAVGGRILGVVLPPLGVENAGTKLQKSTVRLIAWSPGQRSDRVDRFCKLDTDLRFELRGIPPDARCSVSCDTQDFAESSSDSVAVEAGADTTLELRLTRGVRLSGKVIDEAGQPVDGARLSIEIESESGGSNSSSGELNDAKTGNFEFRGRQPGKITLGAKKKGFQDAKLELGALVDGDVRAALELRLSAGSFVAGRVVWPDGSPAEKALVSAVPAQQGDDNEWRPAEDLQFTTAADGSFKITGLEPGALNIAASAAPRAEPVSQDASEESKALADKPATKKSVSRGPRWAAKLENIEPGNDALLLTLQPGFALTGRVVDEAGVPLKKFQIVASPHEPEHGVRGALSNPVSRRFTSDDGSFALEGVHAGLWKVLVLSKGFQLGEGLEIAVPEQLAVGTLTVARVAVVRGQVFDPDGMPLAKAQVELKALEGQDATRINSFGGDTDVTCDAKGKFEFKSAPSGEYSLQATHDGFAGGEPVSVNVAPGQTIDDLRLTVRRGASLVIELLSTRGEKVSGRRISLFPHFDDGEWREARTDAAGKATLAGLAPGEWEITAEPSDEELKSLGESNDQQDWELRASLEKRETATLADGESARIVLGAPPRAPVELRGVVKSGGSGLAGARVQASLHSADGNDRGKFARCDSTGSYRMTLDEPGAYSIGACREGSSPAQWREVQIPDVSSFTLDLEVPTGSISGRVLGPDGAPIHFAGLQLGLQPQVTEATTDSVQAWRNTDESGAFLFDGLPAGIYMITASAEASSPDASAAGYSRETARVILVEGQPVRGVEIRLALGGNLAGIVRDASGQPAPYVNITLRDSSGQAHDDLGTSTDETGHYECQGIRTGTWSIRAMREGEISNEAVVSIIARDTTQLDLDLRAGTELRVEVFEQDGTPIAAGISVHDAQDRQWTAWRTEENEGKLLKISPLAAGQYTVTATNRDGNRASAKITLNGEPTRSLQIKFGGG